MKRYEKYAAEVERMVRDRVLRPGDRLPSVRQACASRKLSQSTVLQAYYLLEARSVIEARPRSGYFVSKQQALLPAVQNVSRPKQRSASVAISDLVFEILGSTKERTVAALGSAFPSPELFPLPILSRYLARGMRDIDPWRTAEDLSPGNAQLRHQISQRYARDGIHIDADEIIITNGALEALNLSLAALTRPGDVVLVESPTFYAALQAIERLNLKVVAIATHPREGIDLQALETALQRNDVKACWFMPNFQNPLGSVMSEAKKQALAKLLATHQVPLIEDDVYGELYFGTQRPRPTKAFDKRGQILLCSSFSKCLAPGYRVGWVAAGKYAKQIERLKLMTNLSTALPSQLALSGYLQHAGYDRHLRKLRQTLQALRDTALRAIARYFPEGTRASCPDGGYFLWVELPGDVDALELHRQALLHDISLAPGQLFANQPDFAHFVRINYGHPTAAKLEGALRVVGELAGKMRRTHD
ncbi:MAG: PLP-dependent aminotransferase family protein [Steroidobacteraceae bacterium]